MKLILRLVLTMLAFTGFFICTSQAGAGTSIEILLTVRPAGSMNQVGPGWILSSRSTSGTSGKGAAVRSFVTVPEETAKKDGKASMSPSSESQPFEEIRRTGCRNGGGTDSLPTAEDSFKDGGFDASVVLQTYDDDRYAAPNTGKVLPLFTKYPMAKETDAGRFNPTDAGTGRVLVVPIKIEASNGGVPQFRPVNLRLKVILPPVSHEARDGSVNWYTFQSLPLKQLEPLPLATPVLKQPRIPNRSVESIASQR